MLWTTIIAVATVLPALGADRLGRALTDDEAKRFGELLAQHDYHGARVAALRFAYRLSHSQARAVELMGRVELRLVRLGWDPAEVSLVKRLCRLVWSEWTHAVAESDAVRHAEDGFLQETWGSHGGSQPSVEKELEAEEGRREARASARARLEKLRASFERAGDDVNLLWLEYVSEEETDSRDVQAMARRSGRDASEFYAAAKRRKRAVRRLLAEERGTNVPEENE
ncbi:MAG: hypothetical protein WBY94_13370 [Polyangiaceae bacterium]